MQAALMKNPITVLLPDSLLENEDTLLLKTRKIGVISRTLTMFRINRVHFYKDSGTDNDRRILIDILNYLSYPPYLRKYSPQSSNLRYTAILPPIHSPSHVGIQHNNATFTSGILLGTTKTFSSVDIGEKTPLQIPPFPNYKKGDIIIVKTIGGEKEAIKDIPSPIFWNTQFTIGNLPLETELNQYPQYQKIAASKSGLKITDQIFHQIRKTGPYIIAFGPIKGSFKTYLKNPASIDCWVNVIPNQGTKTVKIEEALHSALTLMNVFLLNLK